MSTPSRPPDHAVEPPDRRTRPVHVPLEGPPRAPAPSPEIFAAMGEAGIAAMIHDLYAELERSAIRGMFAADMAASAERSAAFFVGLLGGPPRYHERYGPPMMRARHLPFPIDEAARLEWLACFDRALARAPERHGFPAEHVEGFRRFLDAFSRWMVNVA
ncbi:hypothetical protein DCC79_12310 [bacterium]|nr:hypothetical protein [Chloroflexi bacterium CFX6]RIL09005.1 MAG: hypothetical protein DCC79_12310 [bacterium]